MGGDAASDRMTRKRKKKGRPSLLQLQKRSLKRQRQQQIPDSLNSTRRNPSFHPASSTPSAPYDDDDEDDRKRKKHRLLLGLNSAPDSSSYGSNWNAHADDPESALKRRKIIAGEKFSTATDTLHGSPVESGPTTPLPDKKLLVFILDRLQKKDTYGVFSEPVDPDELPDYHEIITNPMDFGTVRKKLDDGDYSSLEQFEKDIFLICSNAMEYNAPDTIYFRQARMMQELAKKDFENLRQDSDDSDPQTPAQPKIVRRGRPPGKNPKKSLESSSFDQVAPEFSPDVALTNGGGDMASLLSSYNLRRGPSTYRLKPADSIVKASYGSTTNETYASWLSEWENEFPASVVKAVMRYGMKHFAVDENRRNTYNNPLTSGHDQSFSTIMDREWKQLVPVGLNVENSYLTSLGRFAADLGPIVRKIASKKTASILPHVSKLGAGWVGDNRTVEQQQFLVSRRYCLNEFPSDSHVSRRLSPEISGSSPSLLSRFAMQDGENVESVGGLNSQTELPPPYNQAGETKARATGEIQQGPLINSGLDGYGSGIGMNCPQMGGTRVMESNRYVPSQVFGVGSADKSAISSVNGNNFGDKSGGRSSRLNWGDGLASGSDLVSQRAGDGRLVDNQEQWIGFSTYNKAAFRSFANEGNARVGEMGSSMQQMGSPQQPDLALQL